MTNTLIETDSIIRQAFSTSWLDELRKEVNSLFHLVLDTLDSFNYYPEINGRDIGRLSQNDYKSTTTLKEKQNTYLSPQKETLFWKGQSKTKETSPKLDDSLKPENRLKKLKNDLKDILTIAARLKTFIPSSKTRDFYTSSNHIPTGSIITPSTPTEPVDSYIQFLGIISPTNSSAAKNIEIGSYIKTPETYFIVEKNVQRRSSTSNFSDNSEENVLSCSDFSENAEWIKVKEYPKNKHLICKKQLRNCNNGNSSVKINVKNMTIVPQDGATSANEESKTLRTMTSHRMSQRKTRKSVPNQQLSSSITSIQSTEGNSFSFPRYISEILRLKEKEPTTLRAIEFTKGKRSYFDFDDYYSTIEKLSQRENDKKV